LDDSRFNGRQNTLIYTRERLDDNLIGAMVEDEPVLTHADLVRMLRRWLWVIALVALVFAGAAAGFSLTQSPTYVASIKMMIGHEQNGDVPPDLGNEVAGLQQLTPTMVEAIKTRPIAESVIQQLNLTMSPTSFLKNLSAEQVGSTQFIEVSYKDPNPVRAKQIVNEVGGVFSERLSKQSPSANTIQATVWEPAQVPDSPAGPATARNILLALALGLMVGGGLAFLLEYFDTSLRSSEEVERISGAPNYGIIPAFEVPKGKKRNTRQDVSKES
jgi:capsular polysaccharide biosynthesis protein